MSANGSEAVVGGVELQLMGLECRFRPLAEIVTNSYYDVGPALD